MVVCLRHDFSKSPAGSFRPGEVSGAEQGLEMLTCPSLTWASGPHTGSGSAGLGGAQDRVSDKFPGMLPLLVCGPLSEERGLDVLFHPPDHLVK